MMIRLLLLVILLKAVSEWSFLVTSTSIYLVEYPQLVMTMLLADPPCFLVISDTLMDRYCGKRERV